MIFKNSRIGSVRVYLLPLVLVALAFPAIAQPPSIMPSHTPVVGTAETVAPTKMRKAMDDMHEKIGKTALSGDLDHDFVLMMKSHHQAAIEMAQIEIDSGKDVTVVKAAKKMIVAQKKDIVEFDDWLKKHPLK